MFSLRTIAVIASFALSTFASALPAAHHEAGLILRGNTPNAPGIISILREQIMPDVTALGALTKQNATAENINPRIDSIRNAVSSAVTQLNGLQGSSMSNILNTGPSGTAGATQLLGKSVTDLLNLVLGTLGDLLGTMQTTGTSPSCTSMSSLGSVLGELLSAVVGLVGGLVGSLIPSLSNVIPVARQIGSSNLLAVLGQSTK